MRFLSGLVMLMLFGTVSAARADTAPANAKNDFVVGVEDVLRIAVWGEPTLNMDVRVRPDGKISFPLVNDLFVDGMTPEQLAQELTKRLAKFIKEPNVTVIVQEINSFRVYLLGEVRTQGAQIFRRPTRLLQAITGAGGLTEFSKKEIILIRDQDGVERRIRIDYKKLIAGEGAQENIFLKPGDTILVQ